jgi:hypothetical protein
MSYKISGTTITLTRGDTCAIDINIFTQDGAKYQLQPGDTVRFAMKQNYSDASPLVVKEIDKQLMQIWLEPEDTKGLNFGNYVYDIQLTTADGIVDTFIPKGKLKLTEEVD